MNKNSTDFSEQKQSFTNPLNDEPVIQNFNRTKATETTTDIPIPEVDISDVPPNVKMGNIGGGSTPPPMEGQRPIGAQPNSNLPDEDSELSAEATADLCLMGFAQLKMFSSKIVKVSEKKLKSLDAEGDIDLSMQVQAHPSNPKKVSINELFLTFNESLNQNFTLSEDYIKVAKPILVAEFKKRGVALSPLTILGIVTAKDFVESFGKSWMQRNELINSVKKMTAEYKKTNEDKKVNKADYQESGFAAKEAPNRREPEEAQIIVNENAPTEIKKPKTTFTEATIIPNTKVKKERKKRVAKVVTSNNSL